MAAISSAQSGNWSDTATWVGGVVPVAGDAVTIVSPHVVTLTDNRQCGSVTVNAGATLILNPDTQLTNLSLATDFIVSGTLDVREGVLIEFNQTATRTLATGGTSGVMKLVGTAAKRITIRNAITTQDVQVRYENGAYHRDQRMIHVDLAGYIGQATKLVEVGWVKFYGAATAIQRADAAYVTIHHCWFARRTGTPTAISQTSNLGTYKSFWNNLVVGYRRSGSAAQYTTIPLACFGVAVLRNVIINTSQTNYFSNGVTGQPGDGAYVDNWGFVDPAMLPGTGSALDLAQGNPGISKSWLPGLSTIEKSAAAARDGAWGCRIVPGQVNADLSAADLPTRAVIAVPIASGDDISVSVWARRSAGLPSTCARVTIDPESVWFTPSSSPENLPDTNWNLLTASASNARGSGLKGTVNIVLECLSYAASSTLDFDSLEVLVGGRRYVVSMDHWRGGMPAVDPPAGGGSLINGGLVRAA